MPTKYFCLTCRPNSFKKQQIQIRYSAVYLVLYPVLKKEDKMKRLSFFVMLIFIVSLFSVSAYAQEVLKLGIPLPLTGTNAKFGEIEKISYAVFCLKKKKKTFITLKV